MRVLLPCVLGFDGKAALLLIMLAAPGLGETCTPQSQMTASLRSELAAAASTMAAKVQANDAAGLRASSVPELAQDFAAISEVVGTTAPHLKGAALVPEQLYLLDASTLKLPANASTADAQFFCNLNRTAAEAEFLLPALPPGKYAFAMLDAPVSAAPWRLSFLLRQDGSRWLIAGFYPKPLTAAGHDGLWYWTEARKMTARKQPWDAWLYLQQADALLQPAGFVQSSHLEKLRTEETSVAPPALSDGVTLETPLVVKAADGTEFRFTSLGVDDSLNTSAVDVAVRLKVDALGDQAAARQRNIAAMSALLKAYPELRQPFHGVWVFDVLANGPTYATEQAMADIP